MRLIIALMPLFFVLLSCSESKPVTEVMIHQQVKSFPEALSSAKMAEIEGICTQQGLEQVLDWTNGLENKAVLGMLSTCLLNKHIEFTSKNNDEFEIPVGEYMGTKEEVKFGVLSFIKVGNEFKINGFMGLN